MVHIRADEAGNANQNTNGIGWMVLLWSVMEKAPEYSVLDLTLTAGDTGTTGTALGSSRSDMYYCPTRGFRRSTGTEVFRGSCPDYVFVGVTSLTLDSALTASSVNGGSRWHSSLAPYMLGALIPSSPRQVVTSPTGGTQVILRSRVTIGGVSDGMSYTALVGEKHLNPDHVGAAWFDNPYNPGHIASGQPGGVRIAGLGLAQRPDNPKADPAGAVNGTTDPYYYTYGSWHPGITQFAFGDARVQAVKNYATTDTLHAMSGRGDGLPFNLP